MLYDDDVQIEDRGDKLVAITQNPVQGRDTGR